MYSGNMALLPFCPESGLKFKNFGRKGSLSYENEPKTIVLS